MLYIYLSPRGRAFSLHARIFSLLPTFLVICKGLPSGFSTVCYTMKKEENKLFVFFFATQRYKVRTESAIVGKKKNKTSFPDLRK